MELFLIILRTVLGGLLLICFLSHLIVRRKKESRRIQLETAWEREQFSVDELRADLQYFKETYTRVHPVPFHSISENDFENAIEKIHESIKAGQTRLDLYRSLALFISTLNDEHTVIHFPEPELKELITSEEKLFPIAVQFISGKCYSKERIESQPDMPVGVEIISINEMPIDQIKPHIAQYFSGTREEQRLYYAQQRFPEALYFAFGLQEKFEIAYRMASGEEYTVTIPGKSYQPDIKFPYSYDIHEDTLVFHYLAFEDPERKYQEFLKNMFAITRQKKINTLIIDMRCNQGGTSSLGDDLLRYLSKESFCQFDHIEIKSSPEVKNFFLSFIPGFLHWFIPLPYLHSMLRSLWKTPTGENAPIKFDPIDPGDHPLSFQGKIFLLIGPGAMSSSSLLAATVKSDEMGKLIGEPTGGFPTHYGNVLEINLPITGITVEIPSSINYGNGEGPVTPDFLVKQTVADLQAGMDTVMEFALKPTDPAL